MVTPTHHGAGTQGHLLVLVLALAPASALAPDIQPSPASDNSNTTTRTNTTNEKKTGWVTSPVSAAGAASTIYDLSGSPPPITSAELSRACPRPRPRLHPPSLTSSPPQPPSPPHMVSRNTPPSLRNAWIRGTESHIRRVLVAQTSPVCVPRRMRTDRGDDGRTGKFKEVGCIASLYA